MTLKHKITLLYLFPLGCLMLSACSTTNVQHGTPNMQQWRAHQDAVQKISHFQTRGKFAYLTDNKKQYARFFIQQMSPESYKLLLTTPFGNSVLDLNVQQNNQVQLTDDSGRHYVGTNAQDMLYKLSGLQIPLDNLRQWMLGLPGKATNITLNGQSLLQRLTFQQDGLTWVVDYQDYDTDITPPLPNRLELKQGDQRIKLQMDNWTL